MRVPWTARRSTQSILKEINPRCSLEGLMLKLKLQYFGYLLRRADLFEKTLMLGKIEGRWRRGQQRMRWLDGITNLMDMGLGGLWELVMDRRPGVLWFMGRKESNMTEQLNCCEYIHTCVVMCMYICTRKSIHVSCMNNFKVFYCIIVY